MRFFKRLGGSVLVIGFMAYAMICAYMAWNQRSSIFRINPNVVSLAAQNLPRAADITLAMADGVKRVGWQIEPARPDAAVIVYFPGNAATRAARSLRFKILTENGTGLITLEHRGYGGSEGFPSEETSHSDARELYAYAQRTYPGRKLIIFGESLGSGIATRLASDVQPDALLLDSAFLSMLDVVSYHYPWLPVRLLLQHPFRSDLVIGEVKAPLLMLHGAQDTLVPLTSGQQLFTLARSIKEMKVYPQARHVQVFNYDALSDVRRFLSEKAAIQL